MGTNSYITKLKAQLDRAIIQREHWKQLAENRNSIVVTEVCPESRSVEEYVIDADSVRASWRLIREYREQVEALRAELAEVKGREAACFVVGKLEKTAVIAPPLPVGAKLYTAPPASPDVEGLVKALTKTVASLDQLLPYLGKIPADVGLINDALVAARPLLEQNTNKEVTPDGK